MAVVRYLGDTTEPDELDILLGLDDPIITDSYGLRVFTGFELTPVDFIHRVEDCTIEELQLALDLTYMRARKLRSTILCGYPISFCILLKLYGLLYPDHELLSNPSIILLLQTRQGN